ncbi:hypothetical protein CHS0354_023905 [Potamilus streckersoni]|uniref:hydroxymethylbilane synthase n=1 Tax=Potamilus streckersoni TaxID=2493646 RepID=A0AAE0VLV2_9BIVA|nr:hypothetical protein CHS0354_023905 [Potamilus streckersoni]
MQAAYSNILFKVKVIKTKGDKILNTPLYRIGDKGLFTKELEDELLANKIDIAVHSLKDMQTTLPSGLMVAAILEREHPQDVLIAKKNLTLAELPHSARLATSSIRRQAELLAIRPDFQFENIRGNIHTRIKALFNTPDLDAMILAKAGMVRLNLTEFITQELSTCTMTPAAAQGAIGVEIRAHDTELETLLYPFDHTPSRLCCTVERSFLNTLEGGCQTPIGVFAEIDSQNLVKLSCIAIGQSIEKTTQDAQREIDAPKQDSGWNIKTLFGLNINQVGFVNWSSGGNTTVGASALINATAIYTENKIIWETNLSLKGGANFISLSSQVNLTNPWRKTDDNIDLKSTFSYIILSQDDHKFTFTSVLNFSSQFTHGYQYGTAKKPETAGPYPQYTSDIYTSNFMSPGYLSLTTGFSYRYKDFLSLYIAPVGMLNRFVLDDTLSKRGSFGVDKGQKYKMELGGSFSFNFSKEIIKNFFLQHYSNIFFGYGQYSSGKGFDSPLFAPTPSNNVVTFVFTSETTIKFAFNEWLSTLLTFSLIYDSQNNNVINTATGEVGRFLQFKNAISIGVSYAFTSKITTN